MSFFYSRGFIYRSYILKFICEWEEIFKISMLCKILLNTKYYCKCICSDVIRCGKR